MTTSITDARFTHLHATHAHMAALLTDPTPADDDKNPWNVMPGYDADFEIEKHHLPSAPDNDDTLPSQIHPSYPFGPPARNGGKYGWAKAARGPRVGAMNHLSHAARSDNKWLDLHFEAMLETADGREVPPVMAGSQRPPSPRSPQLRPYTFIEPRSQHLRRYLERRQQLAPEASPVDQFDAPVPNETYADDEDLEDAQPQPQRSQQQQQQQQSQQQPQAQSPRA